MSKSIAVPASTRGRLGRKNDEPARAVARGAATTGNREHALQPTGAVNPADRQQLIAQAAYFLAERRGFTPGNELDDWLQAEADFEARLKPSGVPQ